jgi:peptidyl-prolyl cis-trans isomerase SurA
MLGAVVLSAGAVGAFAHPAGAAPAAAAAPEAPAETPTAPIRGLTKTISNSSIPILVNDVPITAYDISQRLKLMRLGGAKGATQKAAIEELIDETLEMIEAERRGVAVPDGQANAAFASIASRVKMSPDQFARALGSQGVDASSLKKRLKAQIAWQQLVQRRTQLKASVKTEDVTAALLEKGNPDAMTIREFTLQQIVFVVPSGSPPGVYVQRKREAEAFRQRFPGCERSLDEAKKLRGVVVKDIGRRDSTQLDGPEGEAIQKVAAGKTAPATQTKQGIEIIAVCSTRDIQSTSAVRADVENSLYLKQAEGLGKDYLKELRDRAIIEYR